MPMNETFWKDRTVLVTGGAGFVGRWLCKALQRTESEVHLLDLAPATQSDEALAFHRTDLCNLEETRRLLAAVAPSVVIHLAGQPGVASSHLNPSGAFDSNVTAAFNLFEACWGIGWRKPLSPYPVNHVLW